MVVSEDGYLLNNRVPPLFRADAMPNKLYSHLVFTKVTLYEDNPHDLRLRLLRSYADRSTHLERPRITTNTVTSVFQVSVTVSMLYPLGPGSVVEKAWTKSEVAGHSGERTLDTPLTSSKTATVGDQRAKKPNLGLRDSRSLTAL